MTIRIAVLSDIHGNLNALNAILDDIKTQNVDDIIVAGDLTGDGPQPKQVIDRIREVTHHIIKGNREEYIIRLKKGELSDWFHYDQMSAAIWTYRQMTEEDIEFIMNLPEQRVIDIGGTEPIRMVHGSLFSSSELLYPDRYIERLNRSMDNLTESVLICGHSHQQWSKRYSNKLVVNPGSVGIHFNDNRSAEYAILNWEDNRWNVELKQVSYDLKELHRAFINSGLMEDSPIWTKSIIEGINLGRDITMEFLSFAYKLAEEKEKHKVEYVPNHIWKEADLLWDWKTII